MQGPSAVSKLTARRPSQVGRWAARSGSTPRLSGLGGVPVPTPMGKGIHGGRGPADPVLASGFRENDQDRR